jgi:hypothetical protein
MDMSHKLFPLVKTPLTLQAEDVLDAVQKQLSK